MEGSIKKDQSSLYALPSPPHTQQHQSSYGNKMRKQNYVIIVYYIQSSKTYFYDITSFETCILKGRGWFLYSKGINYIILE